jgi:hypothetical protein
MMVVWHWAHFLMCLAKDCPAERSRRAFFGKGFFYFKLGTVRN